MPTKSEMTVERGLAENVALSIQKLTERQLEKKVCINVWFSKKDASWNVNMYNSSIAGRAKIFPPGKGWDMVSAIEVLRKHYLEWASADLGLEEMASSTFDIEQALDARDGVTRNDVGAIETPSDLLQEISDLKKKFEDILTAVQTLKK